MSLPGVTAESHRGGMIFFHVGRREIGHLHGERLADLPFPVRIREKLVAEKKRIFTIFIPKRGGCRTTFEAKAMWIPSSNCSA
jgi:luciferase-like monooxygenase